MQQFRAGTLPFVCVSSAVTVASVFSLLKGLCLASGFWGWGISWKRWNYHCSWLENATDASVRGCGEAVEGSWVSGLLPHSGLQEWGYLWGQVLKAIWFRWSFPREAFGIQGAQGGWLWQEPWQNGYGGGLVILSFYLQFLGSSTVYLLSWAWHAIYESLNPQEFFQSSNDLLCIKSAQLNVR